MILWIELVMRDNENYKIENIAKFHLLSKS